MTGSLRLMAAFARGRARQLVFVLATAAFCAVWLSHTWTLPQDWHNMQSAINSRVGATILVPYMAWPRLAELLVL